MHLTSILLGAIIAFTSQSSQAGIPIPAAPAPTTPRNPTPSPTPPHTAQYDDSRYKLWDKTLLREDQRPSFPAGYFKPPALIVASTLETKKRHPARAINTAVGRTSTTGSITSTGLGYELPWDTRGQTSVCWECWGGERCCDWFDAKTGHPMTFAA